MGQRYRWVMGVALLVCGCGDDERAAGATDVTGQWCGRAVATAAQCVDDHGREIGYLDLVQSGASVTGKVCESYEKDCNPLSTGQVDGKHFRFYYEFSEFRVDGSFDAQDRGTLTGSFYSNKCGCDIPMTLNRVQ